MNKYIYEISNYWYDEEIMDSKQFIKYCDKMMILN